MPDLTFLTRIDIAQLGADGKVNVFSLERCCQGKHQWLTNVEACTMGGINQIKDIYLGGIVRINHLCLLVELDTCTSTQLRLVHTVEDVKVYKAATCQLALC